MNETMSTKRGLRAWLFYGLMVLFVAGVTGCALLLYNAAGMWMFDSNCDTFQNVLSAPQREAITRSARQLMLPVVAALIITNLCWIVGVGGGLLRKRKDNR